MQCYYYYPTQQMNEAPNTHKQNATRRPSRESVRALGTTAAAPHVCCVLFCMYVVVLCCSLLCGYCSVFGAGGSVQVNTRGYPCRFPGTRLPYSTRKPDQYTRVLGSCPNPAGYCSGFRLTAPNPTAPSTHTQHSTTTTIRASHIRQHTAHPNGYVFYVLLGVWRELETTPLATGKHSDISHISPSIYIEVSAKPLS